MSKVAPEGTVIVSPESPIAKAVLVAGLTLLVFSSLIIVSYSIDKVPEIVHVIPALTVIGPSIAALSVPATVVVILVDTVFGLGKYSPVPNPKLACVTEPSAGMVVCAGLFPT